ncbi:hypothetical protein CHARACLAT_005080 [Characodon lateralis]|uniref:Uncharacterized protein n=1 Tax=Characodon lateralis TaxID=208331 RepID=A0ABU7E1V9_9TELE|nr:hypothetical protein [Characodon lateralis]
MPRSWASPFLSAKSAGPLLPLHRLLHPCPPGGQAAPPPCPQVPPQVFLHGEWSQRSHDARTLVLRHRHCSPQRRQEKRRGTAEKAETNPTTTTQPDHAELQKQLQNILTSAIAPTAMDGTWLRSSAHIYVFVKRKQKLVFGDARSIKLNL